MGTDKWENGENWTVFFRKTNNNPMSIWSKGRKEKFMEELQEQIEKVKQSQELILAGDLNLAGDRKNWQDSMVVPRRNHK